ncbi:MAG: hypothetical protein CMH61_01730 [Nanoarchaeota archaeon]|nr:hypothetical protein [Nanoarchaeota archaeon]|tara:strand:+ start:2987 stop:3799 length:813 start_codon:yes stop_codon:yes gene_type:complete
MSWRWVYYVIPIFALVVIGLMIFGPDKLWENTTDVFNDTVGFIDDQTQVGMDEVEQTVPTIPASFVSAYESLHAALKEGKDSPRKQCLLLYDDFGQFSDFTISLNLINDKLVMDMHDDNGQVITQYNHEIEGLKPCIVGGQTGSVSNPDAAVNFFKNWINPRVFPHVNAFALPEYNWFNRGLVIDDNHKLIASGVEYDLDDEGTVLFADLPTVESGPKNVLYKADDDAVCFIVTHDGDNTCDDEADELGVDDDCVKEFLPDGSYTIPVCS